LVDPGVGKGELLLLSLYRFAKF